MPAVILYGPPAAGKNTVTTKLTELDHKYRLYQRMKVGTGRTDGYRITTTSHVDVLRNTNDILWENFRYNALYVIDLPSLADMLRRCIPILHLGQVEAVKAVTSGLPETLWVVVWLWCPRDVAAARIADRRTGDTAARLRAWDETDPLPDANISINTADISPAEAAAKIHCRVRDQALRQQDSTPQDRAIGK